MHGASPLLAVRGLTKRFAATLALDGVDLELRAGEVHALLGENGAGKSTLIKLLAGVHRRDGGTIEWRGSPADPSSAPLPIAFIHQDLGLVDTMTVAENVAVTAGYPRRLGLIDWKRAREQAREALAQLGGGIDPDARVGTLRAAERSLVAIARALAIAADVLVLDEPTAALPEHDVAHLLEAMRRLRSRGLALLYVTHRLDEVFRVGDRVTVLRDGRKVVTCPVAETTPQALIEHIVGRSLSDLFRPLPPPRSAALLEVDGLVTQGAGPVSFRLPEGEVLGLVGLRGAGHHAVGRCLYGDLPHRGGRVMLAGEPLVARTPDAAAEAGVAFVSSKRGEESLAPNLDLRENLFMNPRASRRRPPLGGSRELADCRDALRRFAVRPADPALPIVNLSGGNQQKVVVARWLVAQARLLVLEEPTFGVDIGARAEIYRLLGLALEQGRAVLLVSSDFEEVAGLCHRALVFDRGRIVAEVPRQDLSVPRLTALASGAEAA
jgi:ribose transport system ATP-binding protein